MVQGLGQRQCLLAALHGLRWIAEAPQGEGRKAEEHHTRRIPMAQHQGALGYGVDEGDALLQVLPGRGVFTELEQGLLEGTMRLQEAYRGSRTLGQPHELFSQITRGQEYPSALIEAP